MITVKVRVEYIHSSEDFEEASATLKKKMVCTETKERYGTTGKKKNLLIKWAIYFPSN